MNDFNEKEYQVNDFRSLYANHRIGMLALSFLLIFGILFHTFTAAVPTGSVGFKNFMGKLDVEGYHEPGLVLRIPFVQWLQYYPTRTYAETHTTQPRDDTNQVLTAKWNVQLFVDPTYAGVLLKEIGSFDALRQKVLDPEISSSAQAETPTYSPEDLVKKRPQLVANIKARLQKNLDNRLKEYKLPEGTVQVIEIACLDFFFSPAFNDSIEKKVEQDQLKQTAEINRKIAEIQADADGQEKELLGKAEAYRTATVTSAQAYAIEIKGAASKLSTLLAPYIQIERWNGEPHRVDLTGKSDVLIPGAAVPAPVVSEPAQSANQN
ncbi:MAG TPA: SPFH domain-containing protein [Candidatus Obscuribacter sp.]|nr:hypothetical protein [Candidatus Obscuribacter sp.]HNG18422.1 SPFH domain-containing protein [Candidatus Obscuribacter sp.]HNN62674.1 SPFH domain-containing protein [Candidatus Obscuribacter sp.]